MPPKQSEKTSCLRVVVVVMVVVVQAVSFHVTAQCERNAAQSGDSTVLFNR